MQSDEKRRRYFILTSGRSGSTLLSAILADAGAEFAMPAPQAWNAGTGAMEGVDLHRASAWLRSAYQISPERPPAGIPRWRWVVYRSFGKAQVRRLLENTRYIKGSDVDLMVNPAFRMGFLPSVIISYRRFEECAISITTMRGHTTMEGLAATYNRVYRNALLWLFTFGGCVVGYDQLTDPNDTSWVSPLAAVTNLAPNQLLESRNRRLSTASRAVELAALDPSATQTFETMDALCGRVIPASAAVLRAQSERSRQAAPASDGPRVLADLAPLTSGGDPELKPAIARSAWARQWLRRLRAETTAYWSALVDRRVPWYARISGPACIFAYTVIPIDPIPDRLPIIGHLDDVIMVVLALALCLRLIPASIKDQHRLAAATRLTCR
jgi:uncharacterized membrane protein YkvA (DUF1232 family)